MLSLSKKKPKKNKARQVLAAFVILSLSLLLPVSSFAAADVKLSVEVKAAPTINDFDFSYNNQEDKKIKGVETKDRRYTNVLKIIYSLPMFFPQLGILNLITIN